MPAKIMINFYCLTSVLILAVFCNPVFADEWSARREYREGISEMSREREKMRRDILNSDNRWEAERAYRKGMRNIERERREMRREVRRELRDRDDRPGRGYGRNNR